MNVENKTLEEKINILVELEVCPDGIYGCISIDESECYKMYKKRGRDNYKIGCRECVIECINSGELKEDIIDIYLEDLKEEEIKPVDIEEEIIPSSEYLRDITGCYLTCRRCDKILTIANSKDGGAIKICNDCYNRYGVIR